jgi:hypothetical protein
MSWLKTVLAFISAEHLACNQAQHAATDAAFEEALHMTHQSAIAEHLANSGCIRPEMCADAAK